MLVRGRWDMRRVIAGTTMILAAFGVGPRAVKMEALCAPSCQAGSDKKWPVKYLGSKLELVITDKSARFKAGEETTLEIPAASIIELGYDNSSHNRGWPYLKVDGPVILESREAAIITAPLLLPPAAVLSAFKSRRHFVRILRVDKGNPSKVFLEVGKRDYHAVLDGLRAQPGAAGDCESPPAIGIAVGLSASLARPKSRNLTKRVSARTTNSDAIKSNRSPQDFRVIESGLITAAFFFHRFCLFCVVSEGIIATN